MIAFSSRRLLLALILGLVPVSGTSASVIPEIRLQFRTPSKNEFVIAWPGRSIQKDGVTIRPWFELQSSNDLRTWTPVGERLRSPDSAAEEELAVTLPRTQVPTFFRVYAIEP